MQNWQYTTKKEFKLKPELLFFITIGVLLSIYINEIIGIVLISTAFSAQTAYSGIEIDIKNSRIRHYFSFLSFSFGRWDELKDIEYIAIVRVILGKKSFQASQIKIIQIPSGNYGYRVSIITANKHTSTIRLFTIKDKNLAFKDALELGKLLKCQVLDSSSPQKRWISPETNSQITPSEIDK